MKNIRCIIAALLVGMMSFSAAAQDERELRGRQIVIELDDEGRVVVNGTRLSESDDPVILRVRPDDGEVELESLAPRRGVHGKFAFGAAPGWEAAWLDAFPADFEMPDLPAIKPLIQGLRFGPGRDFEVHLDEHMEVAELERESSELAREARNAGGAERDELEAELRSHLREIFDRKMELRRDRIDRLQEELNEERHALEERNEAAEEMIERRFRRLMGVDDVLEW